LLSEPAERSFDQISHFPASLVERRELDRSARRSSRFGVSKQSHLPMTFLEQCDELAHLALGLYRQRVKLIKEIL
jgi:hypothetical protein